MTLCKVLLTLLSDLLQRRDLRSEQHSSPFAESATVGIETCRVEALATVNAQLEETIVEVARNADDLSNILLCTHIAMVLLDFKLRPKAPRHCLPARGISGVAPQASSRSEINLAPARQGDRLPPRCSLRLS